MKQVDGRTLSAFGARYFVWTQRSPEMLPNISHTGEIGEFSGTNWHLLHVEPQGASSQASSTHRRSRVSVGVPELTKHSARLGAGQPERHVVEVEPLGELLP